MLRVFDIASGQLRLGSMSWPGGKGGRPFPCGGNGGPGVLL